MKGVREKIIASGADYYITKLIDTRQFAKIIRSLIKEC